MNPVEHIRKIPPPVWLALVSVLGLAFLMWHQFTRNPDDKTWTDVSQPDTVEDFPILPSTGPAHGAGRPLGCGPAFRGRQGYPGVLNVNFDLSAGGDDA